MTIRNLIFSSGGYKGLYIIGAFKHLIDTNTIDVNELQNIWGTSIGSVMGAIICLKPDFDDIIEFILKKPWQKELDLTLEKLLETVGKKGFFGKKILKNFFEHILRNNELSKTITLKELYEHSNIKLNILVTNLTSFTLEIFNHETAPNMILIDALYMSCTIPFVFQPEFKDGNCYMDGAMINAYPLNLCLSELEKTENFDKKEILGFKIVNEKIKDCHENSSIFYFGYYMIHKIIHDNYNYKIQDNDVNEVIIPGTEINIEDAKKILSEEMERKKYIDAGKNYAKIYLNYKKTNL
jgi:predicted acylesterase/phospholipase RssA